MQAVRPSLGWYGRQEPAVTRSFGIQPVPYRLILYPDSTPSFIWRESRSWAAGPTPKSSESSTVVSTVRATWRRRARKHRNGREFLFRPRRLGFTETAAMKYSPK